MSIESRNQKLVELNFSRMFDELNDFSLGRLCLCHFTYSWSCSAIDDRPTAEGAGKTSFSNIVLQPLLLSSIDDLLTHMSWIATKSDWNIIERQERPGIDAHGLHEVPRIRSIAIINWTSMICNTTSLSISWVVTPWHWMQDRLLDDRHPSLQADNHLGHRPSWTVSWIRVSVSRAIVHLFLSKPM